MRRLIAIASSAVLLAAPMAARADQTFLVCKGITERGPFTWHVTLNEAAGTVSMTSLEKPVTVLGGFAPETVTWRVVRGELQMVFRINRLTGGINSQMIVPTSWSESSQERGRGYAGSGQCNLREASTERLF